MKIELVHDRGGDDNGVMDVQMHVEAARLLAFTEDEFMKTLDWTG